MWVKGKRQHPCSASSPGSSGTESGTFQSKLVRSLPGESQPHPPPLPEALGSDAQTPSWPFRNCEHPRGRIPTINIAAKYCKTPNSPICVLPPKRENSLHRHSLIWQANSKPYWQPQACFPNQTAMEPKIALPALC